MDFARYPKQYLIARALPQGLSGATFHHFRGWDIAAAEHVPVRPVRTPGTDAPAAMLLGWAVDGDHLQDGPLTLEPGGSVNDRLDRLAGRFAALVADPAGGIRFRLDAAGLLPAVFHAGVPAIASSPAVLGFVGPLAMDTEVAAVFDFPRETGFLPFGLTPWKGVQRLLPNHELCLDSRTAQRTWPHETYRTAGRMESSEIPAAIASITADARATAEAIVNAGNPVLFLSGGRDSRLVLAACRRVRNRLRCQTIGKPGQIDVDIAAALARRFELRHQVLAPIPNTAADTEDWLERTGQVMSDAATFLAATAARHDSGGHPLIGTGTDMMKGWKGARLEGAVSMEDLLASVFAPKVPVISAAAEAWLAGIGTADAPLVLDLARLEQRYGAWAGPASTGTPTRKPPLSPFVRRAYFDAVMRLPIDYRIKEHYYRDCLQALWPELADVPANRATGLARLRHWKAEAKQLTPEQAKRVVRHLRRLRGSGRSRSAASGPSVS